MIFNELNRKLFDETCSYISEYLDLVQCSLCFRCAKDKGIGGKGWHNCGRIYSHLVGHKTTTLQAHNWAEDTEHGMFHGFCTGIMGGLLFEDEFSKIKELIPKGTEFLFIKEKNLKSRTASKLDFDPKTYSDYHSNCCNEIFSFEKYVASTLVHDFVKVNGREDGHDLLLRSVFPDLMEATYTHAKPPEYKHPLVVGDVLELRRFPDWKDWYKAGSVETLLDRKKLRMVECFYHCIRPALKHMFVNRRSFWIRHGAEVEQDILKSIYPQHPVEWLAVEMDRLPFAGCIQHDKDTAAAPWAYMSGIMCFEDFQKLGGQARPNMEGYRDHLFVKMNARWDDWVFVLGKCIPNQKWPVSLVEEVIMKGYKIVPMELLLKFISLSDNLLDRVKIMNSNIDRGSPR